jgi:hypothetical protein
MAERGVDVGRELEPAVRRPPSVTRVEPWQRADARPTSELDAPPVVGDVVRSQGERLDPAVKAEMEARLGHDFGKVRVHRDDRAADSAAAINARAYVVGPHLVFGVGEYRPAASEGRRLIAHELAHASAGQPGAGAVPGHLRIADSAAPAELAAERVSHQAIAGAPMASPAHRPGEATLHRQPSPDVWLRLTIEESGRAEAVVGGPSLPIVGAPAVGIRRNANGTYDVVGGAGGRTVAPTEIPDLLRGTLEGGSRRAGPQRPRVFRCPSCASLRAPGGTRYMTYQEYRISQMLSPDLLPMTQPIYEARIRACGPVQREIVPIPPPAREPVEEVPPPTPPGTALA